MAALDDVLDPELDESVASMGFIEAVTIDRAEVSVSFRLPTFWCSANFAFLMATDMRRAIEQLPFVDKATVQLVDHFAAGKINRGVAAGLGFSATFAGEAQTDLSEIRRTFLERAFLGRQDRLLRLCMSSSGVETALAMTMAELETLTRHEDAVLRAAAVRYIAIRRDVSATTSAFVTFDGAPIAPDDYASHLRTIRRVRGAAEANAEMCRIYLAARTARPIPGRRLEDRQDD